MHIVYKFSNGLHK